ncbi:MAG: thioesterase family protein [Oscillospiraceae bacterium]|nr:thioesterase family protein [Oscillospiraceae bacterium]
MEELKVGLKGQATVKVVYENTAAAMGSGSLEVFATPAMVALMEQAALESVQPFLEEGQGTVGMFIGTSHLASTPIGMTVRAESELVAIKGRVLDFQVRAYAGEELLGEGTHQRCIVMNDRFIAKALAKKK